MHIYNKIQVLLSTLCYMFRGLLYPLKGDLFRMLKTIVIFTIELLCILKIIVILTTIELLGVLQNIVIFIMTELLCMVKIIVIFTK
jgi:hypothetical protein